MLRFDRTRYLYVILCKLPSRLAFGTRPPHCKESQTSPNGETSHKGSHGEELRCQPIACIFHQTSAWTSLQKIPASVCQSSSWSPRHHETETSYPWDPNSWFASEYKWLFYATNFWDNLLQRHTNPNNKYHNELKRNILPGHLGG